MTTRRPRVRVVGLGRAGLSFLGALERVGWTAVDGLGRDADKHGAAVGVDLVLICTPDRAIAAVADEIAPGDAVVAHVAGSLGLDVLGHHPRRAGIHPLVSLPDGHVGADRLLENGWFAVAGDAIANELVEALGGRSFVVADADRPVYHAAACVAANHVVALLGQVERLARGIGVPAEAYVELCQATVDNVARMGASNALTGPAARGDDLTIARHLEHLPLDERRVYEVMAAEARRLATRTQHTDS